MYPLHKQHRNQEGLSPEYVSSVNEYRASLAGMALEALVECVEERRASLNGKIVEAKKELAWWSKPGCSIDFDYWLAMELWKADEMIVLSLGLDPRKVKYKVLEKEPSYDSLPKKAKDRYQITLAGERAGTLVPRTAIEFDPQEYIQWLKSKGLDYPKEFSVLLAPVAPVEPKSAVQEIGNGERENLLQTIGLLTLCVAQLGGENLNNGSRPNKSAIAKKLKGLISEYGLGLSGHAESSLSKRFKEGLEAIGF